MADDLYISKITVDGVTYKIRDDAALTQYDSALGDLNAITNLTNSSFFNNLIDALYPVGSVYISMNSSAPFSRGTWEQVGKGRALVGVNSGVAPFASAGDTTGRSDWALIKHNHTISGGSHTHTLGSHSHSFPSSYKVPAFQGTGSVEEIGTISNGNWEIFQIAKSGTWHTITSTASASGSVGTSSSHSHTMGSAGSVSSGAGQNYQPSIAVYIWQRTA